MCEILPAQQWSHSQSLITLNAVMLLSHLCPWTAMMLVRIALSILWLTTYSLSTPLHKSHHRTSRKFLPKISPSLPSFDKDATLTVQAATRQKFRNAPALLAGQGTSPGYTIPPSLQDTYNRASDHATNMALRNPQSNSSANSPSNSSSSTVRLATAGTLGCVNKAINIPLLDDTDTVDDLEYYGPFRFGSQEQPLDMDLDTGSADLWVPVDCDCGTIKSFQANASTTYHDTGEDFQVTYGSGFVDGTLVQDTVTVGSLKVYNQSFGAANLVSPSFAQSPSDGLAGLAFSTIANSHQLTLFENLMSHLAAPLFSFYMTRMQPRGSEVCFGGIDQSKVKEGSNISWVQVVSKTYWTVDMTGVLVNSLIPTEVSAIIDTGTSFIYIPDDIVAAIYEQIPGSQPAPDYGDGFYAYPCDTQVMVSFVLGATTLALDPRDMNLGRYTSDLSGSTCVGAIIAAGSIVDGGTIAILGDSLLKSYVSVFDYSHGARVGFAQSISE